MPLSRSSGNPVLVRVFWDGRWPRVSDDAVEVSREVSLQASDDLAFRLAFRKPAVYGRTKVSGCQRSRDNMMR